MDELEQRAWRQRRDHRVAWPSDSSVIEVGATLGMVDAYARRDRACYESALQQTRGSAAIA
jgi:hypothetical protein